MIALKNALPLVRGRQGTAVAFETRWLWTALHDAASKAGYPSWWLVDDLVAGISLYLRNCYVKNVIDVTDLEHVVRAALRDIGYEEVASCFRAVPFAQGISLVQFLQNTPAVNRSAFFESLAEAIAGLSNGDVRHFHFSDLYECVDQLQGEERAESELRDAGLREAIVTFVRERIHGLGGNQTFWCSIT